MTAKLHLTPFIITKLLKMKLYVVLVLHCWPSDYLYHFSHISTSYSILNQFADLRNDTTNMKKFSIDLLKLNEQPILSVILDFNCFNAIPVIEMISQMNLFNQHFQWFIYDEYDNIERFQTVFQNVNLSVNTALNYITTFNTSILKLKSKSKCEKKLLFKSTNTTTFVSYDVYNNGYQLGGQLNITIDYQMTCNRSHCSKLNYLSDLSQRTKYSNRDSLRDIQMRVAVVVTRYDINASSSDINKFLLAQDDFYLDPLARLGFQIFTLLRESLYTNVSLWYTNTWSDLDYTGGIIGALVTQQADLASAPTALSFPRLQYLTPLTATGDFRIVCMFRTPPRNVGLHSNVLFEPFNITVWFCFAISLIVGALLLWLAFRIEIHTLNKPNRQLRFTPSLFSIGVISWGTACIQGSHILPHSIGGRIIFITLTAIGFIMYNYYTSIVVSTLLNTPVKSPIKTMQNLADSDLIVALEPLPYTISYLNVSKRPEIKQFIKRKISSVNHSYGIWLSAQDGIMRMLHKPGFTFVFEKSTGFHLIEQYFEPYEICDLNAIDFRPDSHLFTVLHKNSTYKEIVKLKIVRIVESGIHSKHRRQWVRNKLHCITSTFIISVGFEYTALLFIMLSISYSIAFLILLLELLWKYRNEKKR